MSIFKAYDIRGKYPSELDESKARAIGWSLVQFLKSKTKLHHPYKIAVGRDVRLSSSSLSKNLIKGLLENGAKVTDIGEVTTPMLYFTSGFYHFDASVMVTASHNPPEYNGFKVCRENAIALSETTGLREIEKLTTKAQRTQRIKSSLRLCGKLEIMPDYKKFIRRFIKFRQMKKSLKIVVDTGNGSVGPVFDKLFSGFTNLKIRPLYFKTDGHFPNHEPNPMKDENLRDIKRVMKKEMADLGVAFDGDGDRVIFLDENARRIPNDLITALIAREVLRGPAILRGLTARNSVPMLHRGIKQAVRKEHIVYDLRSSRVVKEEIERLGGQPVRERVGHAFIKATMRRHNAPFGGELSGHYYYRDNFFADSGLITFVYLLNIIAQENKPISQIIKPFQRYFSSGELNFVVADKESKIKEISRKFSDGKIDWLDGITVQYDDWWFNVRPSNTEPLLRLNIEARTKKQLRIAKREIEKILKSS